MELYDKQLAAIELDEHVRPSNSRLVSLRDHDAQALAKTGKKQVLKVLDFWSSQYEVELADLELEATFWNAKHVWPSTY